MIPAQWRTSPQDDLGDDEEDDDDLQHVAAGGLGLVVEHGVGVAEGEGSLVDARQIDVVGHLEAVLHPLDHLGRIGHERVEAREHVLEPADQQRAGPASGEGGAVVHLRQLRVEIGVVYPELEQLRVGELEQKLDILVGGRRLDHQRRATK